MPLSGRELASFRTSLLAWFRQFQRVLPWRKSKDPYRVWLSEIMLQQTRVAAVIPYYERFLERFPDVHSLAEAPEEEVLRLWSGLGYYSRAKNLQKAARQIVGEFGGEFPKEREQILTLSGIGEYTASAIASIAFEEKCAVLDGNVARVLARLGAVRGDLRGTAKWRDMQATADRLLDPSAPGDWNQAMMEFGATLCTPSSPQCLLCPVSKNCEALRLGLVDVLPEAAKKRDLVDVHMVSLVLVNNRGETILLPPPAKETGRAIAEHIPTLVSNMWHFPTLAVKGSPQKTLQTIWKKIFPGKAVPADLQALSLVRHAVTYRKVTVHSFLACVSKLPKLRGATILPLAEVTHLAISNLTRKIAARAIAVIEKKQSA
jgi:A/G-specific adenine glycosylase